MTKRFFSTEAAYAAGILTLAVGTALMERADFGMSMVVAPAYLLHLKISSFRSWYTFGVSEYVFQAFLLIVLSLVLRKFKKYFLFSFVTAVIYGTTLDFAIRLLGLIPGAGMPDRAVSYILGLIVCAVGVALLFHTYIAPEAYELFVMEIAAKTGRRVERVKTVYDCCSCLTGVMLSFLFFGVGHFEGVKWGTVVCALVNGWMIGKISGGFEKYFEFRDSFQWRKYFR